MRAMSNAAVVAEPIHESGHRRAGTNFHQIVADLRLRHPLASTWISCGRPSLAPRQAATPCWAAASSGRTADSGRGRGAGEGRLCLGGHLDRNEETGREEVVLARFVHDPEEGVFLRLGIIEDPIDLPRLEGRPVASTPYADHETTSRLSHCYSTRRFTFMFTRPMP